MDQRGAGRQRLEVSIDEVLTTLASEHRRQILYYVLDNGGVVAQPDLEDYLLTTADLASEKVGIRLRHTSLPMLKTAGVIVEDVESNQLIYNGGSLITEMISTIRSWE